MLEDSTKFSAVAERYIKYILGTRTTNQSKEIEMLRYWISVFGEMKAGQITKYHVGMARDELLSKIQTKLKQGGRQGDGKVSVNRHIARLRHLFTVASEQWGYRNTNPAAKIKPFKESNGRLVFLSTAELLILLEECYKSKNKELYLAVLMIVTSGARKSEVINLEFDQIDFTNGCAYLDRSKNGSRGTLYFNDEVIKTLQGLRRTKGKIFLRPSINRGFNMAVERAGLPPMHIHDLRHTFASQLALSGASLLEIKQALRVKSIKMVERYAHLTPEMVSIKIHNISRNWKVSPEQRGWIFTEGSTQVRKHAII